MKLQKLKEKNENKKLYINVENVTRSFHDSPTYIDCVLKNFHG